MSAIILNGTTFDGLPDGSGNAAAWQPTSYERTYARIGTTLVAANGTRNRVERGVIKRVWNLGWDGTNLGTMNTLRTIAALTASFTFTDVHGTAYTVQVEEPLQEAFAFIGADGTQYWDCQLVLHQV